MNAILSVFKSLFAKQLMTLSSGTIVAQMLPVLASPLLVRFYAPSDIGVYLSLLAIAAVMSTFAALRYDAALAQVKYRKQARALVLIGSLSCIAITLASIGFAFAMYLQGALPDQITKLGLWTLTIPLLTLGNCLQAMLVNINIRHKSFGEISIATIQKACVLILVQSVLGFVGFGISGLVAGSLAATVVGNGRLYKKQRSSFGIKGLNWRVVSAAAARFIDFPIYTMPASIVNSISLNAVILLLGIRFSSAEIGYYGLAQRSLATPSKVVADAFGQVFLQRLTAFEKSKILLTMRLYRKSAVALTIISFFMFVPAYFLVVPVFVFVFGSDWQMAGEVAQTLIPLVAVRFVVSPLSVTTQFHGLNSMGLALQLALLTTTMVVMYFAAHSDFDLTATMRLFANTNAVIYFLFGLLTYGRLAKLRKKQNSAGQPTL